MPYPANGSVFPTIFALVFGAVILLLAALYLLWGARRGVAAQRLQRRLDAVSGSLVVDGQRALLKRRRLSDLSSFARVLSTVSLALTLERVIGQAGLRWTVGRLLLSSAAAGAMGFLLAFLGARSFLTCLLIAAVMAVLPWFYVSWRRGRRLRKLEQQLPEALDLITRALRAGHSFSLGIQLLSEEMPGPIAGEFRIVHEEVGFGVSLQQALASLCERVPVTDYRFFAVSVMIQRQSGGNLTEVLGNLSRLIRDRLKLFARIRVLSSEGRMSAWTLALLPFALAGLLYLANPEFIAPLWTDPIGVSIVQTLSTMMLFGVLVLIRIVKIRV